MNKTREQLEADLRRTREAIHRLEAQELDPAAKALVGKCFKYRNSYGVGSEDWWMYVRVIDAKHYMDIRCLVAQRTSRNSIEIRQETFVMGSLKSDGYQRITRRQFNSAVRRILDTAAKWTEQEAQP